MRIGFIEPFIRHPPCGGIRRILEVSNYLVDFGHEVFLFTPGGKPSVWIPNKAPVLKLSKIKKYEFDVVVFNLADQYKIALESNAQLKVFWVLAPEALYKAPQTPTEALNEKFFFIANSNFTKNYILERIKVDYDIPITPGGINKEHFKYDPRIKKYHHVLFYDSNRPWKGSSLVKSAIGSLGIKPLGMNNTTPQHQMYTLYNKSTVFVSACLTEGFNMPILEAFACGCPVVCTDDGGNRDFVKNGVNAIVVKRDVQSIRLGVRRLIDDRILRRRLRKAGLQEASKPKYEWINIARKFESIIGALV